MQQIDPHNLLPSAMEVVGGLPPGSRVRVGIDLMEIAEVEAAMARYGARYERRLFTDGERTDATGTPAVRAASLAARFAAKEAVLKVLADGEPPTWRSIEVRRAPGRAPELHLHGQAARLAADADLTGWSVSLSHSGGMAAAVVAAVIADDLSPHVSTNDEVPQ